MKNLSAFPRLPLSEALMILITLVVCLAGFTKAEVNTNYKKQDPNLQKHENFLLNEASFLKNFPDTHQASEMRGHELRGKHFFNLKNFPESFLDRPIKRQSDYFGDSSYSDSEKESDGYGYDDDEYYHFNYKRNDEPDGKIESTKSEKETVNEAKEKDLNMISSNNNNQINQKNGESPEIQSIEMLNYQESHPVVSQEDPANPFPNSKPFSDGVAHPKAPSSNSISSLRGIDFKENSAINENNKERKEESATLTTSDSKIVEAKKEVKASDEKSPGKQQDLKLGEDSEKKEKEAALKDEKDSVASKSLNDNSKTTEEKEKDVKLSDNAKLKDNLEKISNSKSKDSESTKLTKEDKDAARFTDKINSDVFNSNRLSEISGGASFVGNDYKDNLDVLKSIRSEGDQKTFEEIPESEKNIGFGKYSKDSKESQEKFKEKHINSLKAERTRDYELLNRQTNLIKALQGAGKSNPYSKGSPNLDFQGSNNFFRRREPWRETEKMGTKFSSEFQIGQQLQQQIKQDQQQQSESNLESMMKHSLTNLPLNELENTEYHKNFMKSLKKYKAQNESARNSTNDASFYMTHETTNLCATPESKKKMRSKPKKRRSMALENNSEDHEKAQKEKNKIRNQKRKTYNVDDSLSGPIQECLKKPHSFQSLNEIEANKEETNLLGDKKYNDQWFSKRQRRKSPQKLEYEIKIINQKPLDSKNAKLSHFICNRLKKDVKSKSGTEDKYLKKYPYSQVSRDELTKMFGMKESDSEKNFKRKASIWKRDDQKSIIKTRAVPSGYYGNRVKFGQKNYMKNNEKATSDSNIPNEEINRLSRTYFTQTPSEANKNILQRAWENKRPSYKHEPAKRFDESQHSNTGNSGNSLLLLKKDDRMTKVLQEENPSKPNNENEISPGQLAKILSEDKNYIVFKKTDTDKLRKNSETEPFSQNLSEFGGSSYANRKFPFFDSSSSSGVFSSNAWTTPLKSSHIRSSHYEKNDKKFTSAFQNTGTNSNLKKAIDKFRDMADFFKDTEQETTDSRYSTQIAKERPDIVFSQDKLPDPIIISNDDSNKESGLKQESVNSIFAISNNFKNLDQQSKKIDFPETKGEVPDSNWRPALKQIFPEAKSINSVIKNGNEIIVLDLNGNPLKIDSDHIYKSPPKEQSRGAAGFSRLFFINPNQYLNSKRQEITLSDIPFVSHLEPSSQSGNQDKTTNKNRMNLLSNDRAVAIIRSADNQSEIPGSLHELAELPEILKTIMIKVPLESKSNLKLISRKNLNEKSQNEGFQNYNQFLQDFGAGSGMKIKKEVLLSPNGFPEQLTYNDRNMRNLRNALQSLANPVSLAPINFNDLTFDRSKNPYENQKSNEEFQDLADYQPVLTVKRQNQWSTQEKGIDFIPFGQEVWENGFKPGEEINNILRLDGGSLSDNNNENKLRKELAAASEKIHRLRREGMEAGKLRKTIEDALAFKQTRESDQSKEFSDVKEDKNKKYSSATAALKSDDKLSIAEETENEKNLKSHLKEAEETKEASEVEKSSKSDYENHLSELFENLNANKNQKNSNENTGKKKKRMDTSRRKRFTKRDVSNKVSKTEVQNKVIKGLAEDNYRSVYSSGLKRKLLSTSNEVKGADSYSSAHKHVNTYNVREVQGKYIKNIGDKCADPMIVKLFSDVSEAEKSRARRSLTSAFHANFKREIDLDESMPNDFQNFLVTSLGGFGSQKREVVKKGEAVWEGKEIAQENYNQIVDNGKDGNEDSALEKREVSSNENRKSSSYKKPAYFSTGNQDPNLAEATSINHSDKSIRSDDATMIKSKPTKFADEKLPTQIRIQISNASSKEKKSSKPIMDENETTSTEMENLPKEKEFFDKNKLNPLLSKNYNKLRQHSGATYSGNKFEEVGNKNLGFKRKSFRPYWWDERIRKKSTAETPVRPGQDFSGFDQKDIGSLIQNQQSDHDSDQSAQKVSMITRLPQVETVYNPTQGGNKAQIDNFRLAKTNAVKNKAIINAKNNLQSNEGSSFDDGFLKSFFKIEEMKSEKGNAKNYGDPDWKAFNEKPNLEQEYYGTNFPTLQNQIGDSVSYSGSNMSPLFLNNYLPSSIGPKWIQSPYSNYFYHGPSNVMNTQVMYDVMKLKQQMKNRNGYDKENLDLKQFLKPVYSSDEMQENVQKSKSNLPSYPNWMDGSVNNIDYSSGKKPLSDFPDNKNFDNMGVKSQNSRDFGIFKHSYSVDGTNSKYFYKKPSTMDASQMNSVDNSKDSDYMESLEDEYPEMETTKQPQIDDGLYKMFFKETNKAHVAPSYRHFYNYKNYKNNYKNSELDNNLSENEKEFDEEYEENGEDEDLEDYSQSGYKKEIEPEMARFSHNGPKLQGGFLYDLNNKYYNHYYPDLKSNSFEETKFNSNPGSKSNLAAPVEEIKDDADPVSGSNDLLKKANEKANIFGKNLIKKLYGTSRNEIFSHLDKFQNEKSVEDTYHAFGNKLSKRKLNSLNENPEIQNRVFHATKAAVGDVKDLTPSKNFLPENKRMTRHTNYSPFERNPFNAEFASGESDFDQELEERGIHFNDNFISLKKSSISQHDNNFGGFIEKNTCKDKGFDKVKDVEENLEGGGEDNILENVIEKYILRKKIKSSSDSNKASKKTIKLRNLDKTLTNDSKEHKLRKRSVGMQRFDGQAPKALKKRLSSGHLTENNFRKYHKKNLTKKRHISDLLSSPYTFTALIDNKENSVRKEKAKDPMKRSALDIFRKITSKEKDNKRIENSDARTAGFEPLLSLNDKSKGFIKDSKDTISLQEKQLAKDDPQAELKNNPPELKAHYPNEGQRLRTQLTDRKKGKAKEAEQVPLTINTQGPWKVELNDKYDRSDLKKENGPKAFKETEKTSMNNQNGRYKAFLVISNNANTAEQNSKSSHPGLFHRETSSSYWPKSDECIRLSTNRVRKRSLKPSINRMEANDKEASQTSASQVTKGTVLDNDINVQEKNAALFNTKSLSDGDSKFQAMQRNAKKNRSFATDSEENRNSQFFLKEKSNNRKSVYPSSSDANIIRDSRHINEETSEYHSQRIVDAILSQVSENSKFKELIGPGLVIRTTAYREGIDSKSKAAAKMNFSEELQSFLQKFTIDLENLAEQHVKKRMCNKIDKDLKQFLQSLLSVPVGNVKENVTNAQQEKCLLLPLIDMPQRKNLSQIDQNFYEYKQNALDNLKKKQFFLKNFIENYQNLSKVKKETLLTNYSNHLQELEQTNGKFKSSKNEPCLITNSDYCEYNCNKTNCTINNPGLNNEELQIGNATSNCTRFRNLKTPEPNNHTFKSNSGSEIDFKPLTKTEPKKKLLVLCFYRVNNPNKSDTEKTTPSPFFENTVTVNDANIKTSNSDNVKNQIESQSDFKDFEQKRLTPLSFDLLSFQASTKKPEAKTHDSPTKNEETIRVKHSSANKKGSNWEKIIDLKNSASSPAERHKPSLGDAAGLQTTLKNQGSRVSNFEIAKTTLSAPSATQSKRISSQQKDGSQVLQKLSNSAMAVSSVENFENPKFVTEVFDDNNDAKNLNWRNFAYFRKKPRVIWSISRKIYIPKAKPFDSVSKSVFYGYNCFKFRPAFIIIAPLPWYKKPIYISLNFFNWLRNQRKHQQNKFLRIKILKKKNVVPRFLTHHPKRLREVPKRKN